MEQKIEFAKEVRRKFFQEGKSALALSAEYGVSTSAIYAMTRQQRRTNAPTVRLRLDDDLYDRLQALASQTGKPITDYVSELLLRHATA